MNINEVINVDNRFLKAVDLKGRKVTVRIKGWSIEDFNNARGGGSKRQIVLEFHGAQKVLGLNKINTKMIASMHGEETDGWLGKQIVLYPTKTQDASGAIVDCIRVEYVYTQQPPVAPAPMHQPAAPAQQPQPFNELNPPPADDMNDSVPF